MPEPVLFDPAIEVLLREIAADPDSCLLRVPRPSVVKSLAHRQGVVRSSATGLSSAERELLRVHRAELAKLLREACVLRLSQHPRAEFELTRHLTATRQTPVMSAPAWRTKARYTLAAARTSATSLSGLDLLDACIAPGGVESTSVAQLSIASMRLEPTDSARIYPAIELSLDGNEDHALRVLHDVVAGFCSRAHAACAWTEVGRSHARRGSIVESRNAYTLAAAMDNALIMPALSLLDLACEFGSVEEILVAETTLNARLVGTSAAVTDHVAAIRGRRATGAFELPGHRVRSLIKSQDQVGPAARMIINALI